MSSHKRRQRRKKKDLLRLEPLFRGVREALFHDTPDESIRLRYGLKERGEDVPVLNDGAPPYVFKWVQQLMNFDKRIIWETDKSFDDLSALSFADFAESQKMFNCPEPLSLRATLVIQEARRICAEVLGEFNLDDWLDSCSFGKRAAVKLPMTECYLDTRFSRISGTQEQLMVFNQCLARDVHLFRAVRKRCRQRTVENVIKAVAVPKSWKTARIMAPDSILGGFLSRGLGAIIRARLEENTDIDLAVQQDRHRRWARRASKNGKSATIDKSKASDSYVWRHIELLVPEDWHWALDVVRTPLVEIQGDVSEYRSYMLMGSGHTFPLQTLLFYCLASAVRNLLKSRGKVSVYGDDIILPTQIAKPFIVVMSELGFTVNSEKSFFDEPDPDRPNHTFFRESCGGDYKGGVDVRPYMPECDMQSEREVSRNHYLAWCHKILNGLLDHWDIAEIPLTVTFLLQELSKNGKAVCFVPSWEVDHAGIRHYIAARYLVGHVVEYVRYVHSIPAYYRLTFQRSMRKRAVDERPYVWYSYWQHRGGVGTDPRLNARKDPYDVKVSLQGEPNRRQKGKYRWKLTGPKYLKWNMFPQRERFYTQSVESLPPMC